MRQSVEQAGMAATAEQGQPVASHKDQRHVVPVGVGDQFTPGGHQVFFAPDPRTPTDRLISTGCPDFGHDLLGHVA